MQLFFGMLTLAVVVSTLALIALRIAALRNRAAREALATMAPAAVPLAALIAVTSMAGSLYFSEIANYLPCTLCWYQRIAMYSLAVILTIAVVVRDRNVRRYSLPLAGIGIVISSYHYMLERFPQLDTGVCNTTIPCEYVWFEKFGFVTLPFMALTGFTAIFVLTSIRGADNTPETESDRIEE
jgi:disulfide bond formation protein DsbB